MDEKLLKCSPENYVYVIHPYNPSCRKINVRIQKRHKFDITLFKLSKYIFFRTTQHRSVMREIWFGVSLFVLRVLNTKKKFSIFPPGVRSNISGPQYLNCRTCSTTMPSNMTCVFGTRPLSQISHTFSAML